jgi:hypothetical protein
MARQFLCDPWTCQKVEPPAKSSREGCNREHQQKEDNQPAHHPFPNAAVPALPQDSHGTLSRSHHTYERTVDHATCGTP